VFQLKVVAGAYGWVTDHVVAGGGSSQNWYVGAAQSVDVAVNVIVVPGACGDAGFAEMLADVHGLTSSW